MNTITERSLVSKLGRLRKNSPAVAVVDVLSGVFAPGFRNPNHQLTGVYEGRDDEVLREILVFLLS